MQSPLPTISQQERLLYRTTVEEVTAVYQLINSLVFSDVLVQPVIEVKRGCRHYWGMCYGTVKVEDWNSPLCKIQVQSRWYAKQWMVAILAHEMCHQYQWMNLAESRLAKKQPLIMSHGPSFFLFKDALREYEIPLRREYSKAAWFKHQNFFKNE